MNASHTKNAASPKTGLLMPEQEEKLHEVARSRSETNQRGRQALMLLHLHGGKTQKEVAEMFYVAERTVRHLVEGLRERGLESLDRRPSPQRRGSHGAPVRCARPLVHSRKHRIDLIVEQRLHG